LRSVQVKAEDISVISAEMLLSADKAERALRDNGGDLQATLVALIESS